MERARGRYDEETAEIRGNEMTLVENGDRADHVAVAAQHLHARARLQVPDLFGRRCNAITSTLKSLPLDARKLRR